MIVAPLTHADADTCVENSDPTTSSPPVALKSPEIFWYQAAALLARNGPAIGESKESHGAGESKIPQIDLNRRFSISFETTLATRLPRHERSTLRDVQCAMCNVFRSMHSVR
jgi:hypothetical protein